MSNVVKFSVMSTAVLMGLWSSRIDLSDLLDDDRQVSGDSQCLKVESVGGRLSPA